MVGGGGGGCEGRDADAGGGGGGRRCGAAVAVAGGASEGNETTGDVVESVESKAAFLASSPAATSVMGADDDGEAGDEVQGDE